MTPDRRVTDSGVADLRVVVANHIGRCDELNKLADTRHAENLSRMDTMNEKLDQLLDAHKVAKAMRSWARVGWVGLLAVASGAGWLWDHWKPIAVIGMLAVAGSAAAHEDDAFLQSLQTPTGGSCCSMRDCSLTDEWDQRGRDYLVRHAGVWRQVPDEIVIRGKGPHPSGRAVLCVLPAGEWICFLPGAPQT